MFSNKLLPFSRFTKAIEQITKKLWLLTRIYTRMKENLENSLKRNTRKLARRLNPTWLLRSRDCLGFKCWLGKEKVKFRSQSIKYTHKDHPDYELLQEALELTKQVGKFSNSVYIQQQRIHGEAYSHSKEVSDERSMPRLREFARSSEELNKGVPWANGSWCKQHIMFDYIHALILFGN